MITNITIETSRDERERVGVETRDRVRAEREATGLLPSFLAELTASIKATQHTTLALFYTTAETGEEQTIVDRDTCLDEAAVLLKWGDHRGFRPVRMHLGCWTWPS